MEAKKINFEFLIFGLSVIAFLLFLATSFNSFYWMDDFWKRYELIQKGFFSFQREIYLNWDGRAISPIYSLRNLLLYLFDYPQAWVVTLIGMGFLTGTGYFMLRLISARSWENWSTFQKITLTILFSQVLVMVFRPHLSRSLYWGTGTYYIISLFFTMLAVYTMVSFPKSRWNFLLLGMACTAGPNNGIMILTFLIFANFLGLISMSRKYQFINGAIGIVCLALIVLAPGNFSRGGDSFVWNFPSMIHGIFYILKEYSGMSLWVVIGGVFLGLILDFEKNSKQMKVGVVFLISALSSILPFLPLSSAASKHTAVFFQVFMLVSIVSFVIYFKPFLFNSVYRFAIRLIPFLFLMYFFFQISVQLKTGSKVKEEIDKRFIVLEKNRGSKVALIFSSINIPKENWVSRFWDMNDDPNYSCNQYFQKYFDVGEISVRH